MKFLIALIILIACTIICVLIKNKEKRCKKENENYKETKFSLIFTIIPSIISSILVLMFVPQNISIYDIFNNQDIFNETQTEEGKQQEFITSSNIIIETSPIETNIIETNINTSNEVETIAVSIPESTNEEEFHDTENKNISFSEVHSPNDYIYTVNVGSWNPDLDIGINGIMYDGGMKITMSNLFMTLGANTTHDLTSRITLQFPKTISKNSEDRTFSGTFVLDQTMFGSKSHGVIKIIINGSEVFSTEELKGNTTKSFPFTVNIPDTNVIIIEADVTLIGSDFIYGIVDSKE